jgi:hypothetical protein
VRTTVRQGSPLPVEFTLENVRLGDEAGKCDCGLALASLTVDGVAWMHDLKPLQLPLAREVRDTMRGLAYPPQGVTLAPGEHVARLAFTVQVSGYPEAAAGKVPDPWQTTVTLPFHVVDATQPSAVTLVPDPALADAVNKSIFPDKFMEVIDEDGRLTLVVKGTYLKLPIDVAAQAQVRWGDRPFVPVGYVALRQGLDASSTWSAKCPLPAGLDDQVKSVTLQLVPSSAAAERTIDMTRVWQDPIPLGEHSLFWVTARRPAPAAP